MGTDPTASPDLDLTLCQEEMQLSRHILQIKLFKGRNLKMKKNDKTPLCKCERKEFWPKNII